MIQNTEIWQGSNPFTHSLISNLDNRFFPHDVAVKNAVWVAQGHEKSIPFLHLSRTINRQYYYITQVLFNLKNVNLLLFNLIL